MVLKTCFLIPARMESTRFPGKALELINGIPMIVLCARNAIGTDLETFVCTDSKEIGDVCQDFGVKVIFTSSHPTGTDRIAEACDYIDSDYIINLQGDEPMMSTQSLLDVVDASSILKTKRDIIVNAISVINYEEALDRNTVKCALSCFDARIKYFSREPIKNFSPKSNSTIYFKQLGIYSMAKETLKTFTSLSQSPLEKAEKVEMLRWIENNNEIYSCLIDQHSISVDTQVDLENVIKKLG